MTPLPSTKGQELFPVEEKDLSDDEVVQLHQKIARNGDILAQWDDNVDDYLDNISDEDQDDQFQL